MIKGMKTMRFVLTIGTIASVLTSCSTEEYSYPDYNWQDGLIVTIGGKQYTFEEVYQLMEGSQESAQALYSTARDILAQLATPATDSMISVVDNEITELENTWREDARTNGTSYKEEMENYLDEQGVDDEDELRRKMISEQQIQNNSDNFYLDHDGTTDPSYLYSISEEMTKKYVEKERPYHVSHILVNVAASDVSADSTAYYNGQISSDNARKISQTVTQLASSATFGDTAMLLSDDGSKSTYGELGGDSSNASMAVGMQKSTSYVNEFKLGIYAYDTFLNPDTKNTEGIRDSLQIPGYDEDNANASSLNSTEIAQGHAYGIPLSVALTLGEVYNQDRADSGRPVAFTDDTQLPRNILFNNYFNNHGVSFIYDDSDTYDSTFLANIQAVDPEITTISGTSTTSVEVKYPSRYEEYLNVKSALNNIDSDKFATVEGVSDSLVAYTYDNESQETTISDVSGSRRILTDERGNPIIVVRAGTSGDSSYQGIHFIVVNHDPFEDPENDYVYWRVNIPEEGSTGATSTDWLTDPSYVNFINGDPNSNTAYDTRIANIQRAVRGYDSNIEFELFEANLETVTNRLNISAETLFTADYWNIISSYIEYKRASSDKTATDSLDSSWETYVNVLNLQQDIAPKRVVPTVCVTYYQNGQYGENGEMEELCHVER